jgi:hypothetical protein
MRIKELLEGKFFKDLNFVKPSEKGREIDYDLVEDLIFFMNHNDDAYRRYVYPSIARCVEAVKADKKTNPSLFKSAIENSYNMYIREYPIRELPDKLSEEVFDQVCDKMHEEVRQHINDGKYKD